MSTKQPSRVIFIGNIPYGLTEEQIIQTFGSAGQVLSFRLVHDKDTGRPKGFGFMEFADKDQAASAVRNLNDFEIMGRNLRVDYSNEGSTGLSDDSSNRVASQGPTVPSLVPSFPPGQDLPPNVSAPDAISRTLASFPPKYLLDTVTAMKQYAETNEKYVADIFRQSQPLCYAIFQALLLLDLVDTSALASVVQQTQQGVPPQAYPGPSVSQPAHYGGPPAPPHYGGPPAPPQPAQPAIAGLTPEQKAQVMAMTEDQINALGAPHSDQIRQLRYQIQTGQI